MKLSSKLACGAMQDIIPYQDMLLFVQQPFKIKTMLLSFSILISTLWCFLFHNTREVSTDQCKSTPSLKPSSCLSPFQFYHEPVAGPSYNFGISLQNRSAKLNYLVCCDCMCLSIFKPVFMLSSYAFIQKVVVYPNMSNMVLLSLKL